VPHIHQLSNEEATGAAKRELDAAVKRAGRVWNIVRIMSLNGEAMSASMRFYAALMFGEGPLTRAQREMLATVVSRINVCHY
jgi:alkylhydroperoxidase family enzyme